MWGLRHWLSGVSPLQHRRHRSVGEAHSLHPANSLRLSACRSRAGRHNILTGRWREIGIAAIHADSAPGTFGGGPVTVITTDFGARGQAWRDRHAGGKSSREPASKAATGTCELVRPPHFYPSGASAENGDALSGPRLRRFSRDTCTQRRRE